MRTGNGNGAADHKRLWKKRSYLRDNSLDGLVGGSRSESGALFEIIYADKYHASRH